MYRLETARLVIRSLTHADLTVVHHILDIELSKPENEPDLGARKRWLDWTILGYEQFAALHQPPFGERGVVLKETEDLIGLCGFAPCMDRFEQLPGLAPEEVNRQTNWTTNEIGLYYAISPAYQGRGFASEAARVILDYGFGELGLKRIIATTTYDNLASQAVMRKLGMNIRRNPYTEPEWLQIVGVLENPGLQGEHLG
jgi:RimJ/RimL family protein N-acetyltransferase